MKKDEVINILTEYATNERISKLIGQNEEYRTALKNEEEMYQKFDKTLTDEQKILLNSFTVAGAETAALSLKFTYQQGLKDMFNLLMSLQDKDEVIKQ